MPTLLEVCVDTWRDAEIAAQSGADRIELCASLDKGGLTPPELLMSQAATLPVPVYAMIRPRGGDFVFDRDVLAQMERDIAAVRKAGLAGVVLGAQRAGELDLAALERLVQCSDGLGRTLHRVVDALDDPVAAVEQAITLGFERILTSGGAEKAIDGLDVISSMVGVAAGRISIMPGAGIGPHNAASFLSISGLSELHGSFSVPDPSGAQHTDPATVGAMRRLLDAQAV